ncbi:MMPL family transporter [bacterium]|nr:MMPL family transporter [bacterium]MBU1435194.1 MMPL family transporter [bacterium]MBU1502851.1 MMPL family transporter [bacterium]
MDKYIEFLNKQKYKIIVLTTLMVALLSISLKDIAYEGSYKIWFDRESKILKDYEHFRNTFSGDDSFIVAFCDENGIFNKKAIGEILKLTAEFKKIDGVVKVDSLTNYQHISAAEDDVVVQDFINSFSDLQSKEQLAHKDKLILHQLISKDAKTTMLAIRLTNAVGADEDVNIAVLKKINKILDSAAKVSGYKFYVTGAPAITASLVNISQKDAKILMPLAVVMVVTLLFVLFRNVIGVLVPSVVIVFTFLTVLSTQILLGYKLNNFTVNIPSFITAIAIADAMHLYLAWVYYRMKKYDNYNSVRLALSSNMLPIALTSLTTAVGFASLGLSSIEPIATFGIAVTMGAVLAFILSVTLAPAILLTLKDDFEVKPMRYFKLLNTKGYGAFIMRNNKKIIYVFIFLMLVLGYGLSFLKVDSNSMKYFSKTSQVREGSEFVEKNLTGSMLYEIVLDSKQEEGVKDPDFLNMIIKFEDELRAKYENIRFTTSLKDIVIRMQNILNPDSMRQIPEDKNLVAQYLLLYSMSLPQGMEINDKVDTSEQFLRLSINVNLEDTSKALQMIEWIKNWWTNNTKYSADVQGQTAIFAYMQSSVTKTLLVSISVTLIIVTIFMFIIFRNLKMLWLFMLPNIAPIVLVGGVMGYLDINIDLGVAISASVILGIAVDDTIHFFSKYFESMKTKSFEESIDYIISHSGNAMILTTMILSFTFGLFYFSDFLPNVNFAIVSVSALNIALLFDLALLPALLSLRYFRNK